MGEVVSFCNQKGGTAKTTTVVNLAAYLALAGKKVLLVDADPQGNASSGFGIDKDDATSTTYDVLLGTMSYEKAAVATAVKGLDVIPANTNLAAAEVELVAQADREMFLKRALAKAREVYDFIVIDAPPSLGILTINILCASDSVVVPIQCEYYALEGVSRLVHTLDMVKERLNEKLEIKGILMTMADFRTRLTIQVIEEVRGFFKQKVYDTVIPRNVRLSEAPSFGKPVYLYDKNSIGAKAYFKFASEFLKEEIKGVYDAKDGAGERAGLVDLDKDGDAGKRERGGAGRDQRIFVY